MWPQLAFSLLVAATIPAPDDWRKESFPIPLVFAPSIPFEGTEHVRFPPFWAEFDSERGFTNAALGFCGQVDMIAQRPGGGVVIIDWKTQSTYEGKPAAFYEDWALQLAGYAGGTGNLDADLMSVVISRNEPGRIDVKTWKDADRWWGGFQGLLVAWQCIKNYFPQDAA